MNALHVEIQKLAAPLRLQVLDSLRQGIISGRLAPGARITERELTEMLGVSRTVIREALRQLETEGLVANVPNKGPVVRELSLEEAKDLYSIRAVLEGFAARLFAENASEVDFNTLEEALEGVVTAYESGDANRVLETKNGFYAILFEGASSATLSSMLNTLHARIWRWRALGLTHPDRSPERSLESIASLRAVLAAIRQRDGESAERTTREEANKAANEIMRLLGSAARRNP
ncbi:MAG TPA: GntR family transcriptional regulator [Burkholderiales bacterium]|jgi:DNA-binding GntR family transcriptional regulator|nr:GntR family transcriptional regulator [Burkholderiales bacterium]